MKSSLWKRRGCSSTFRARLFKAGRQAQTPQSRSRHQAVRHAPQRPCCCAGPTHAPAHLCRFLVKEVLGRPPLLLVTSGDPLLPVVAAHLGLLDSSIILWMRPGVGGGKRGHGKLRHPTTGNVHALDARGLLHPRAHYIRKLSVNSRACGNGRDLDGRTFSMQHTATLMFTILFVWGRGVGRQTRMRVKQGCQGRQTGRAATQFPRRGFICNM